jgi:HK97 family phage major capsid protein
MTVTLTNSEIERLEKDKASHLKTADNMVSGAERQKRDMNATEKQMFDSAMSAVHDLDRRIAKAKGSAKPAFSDSGTASRRAFINSQPRDLHLPQFAKPEGGFGTVSTPILPNRFSRDYRDAFHAWLGKTGPMNAALYEGSNAAGGYAVPIVVDDQIVPLAPQDSAVRRLAEVIPTKSDIKFAQITVRTPVSAVAETTAFPTASPTLGGFTLSAFLAGVEVPVSLEFAQDVTLFNSFVLQDVVSAFLEYEEGLFISGTGSGQAQGLIGNVSGSVTEEPDGNGNLVSIQGTLDILGTVKEKYHAGASWLMQRATSLIIRKAQVGSNLYEPVFRRENGVDLLHGYPCEYSSQMATAARGAAPILFGDFRAGYVVGDRGGSALFVKVLDQIAAAAAGEINLMFYRRTDGRVRRSEALAQYNIAAS